MWHTLQEEGLKVVFTRAVSGRAHEIALPGGVLLLVAGLALAAAAWLGTVWQQSRDGMANNRSPSGLLSWGVVPAAQASLAAASRNQATLDAALGDGVRGAGPRDATFVRENLAVLAGRVGALQAQVVALDSMNRRLMALAADQDEPLFTGTSAMALKPGPLEAGVPQQLLVRTAEPASAAVLDHTRLPQTPSAEAIGRQLDTLQREVSARSDALASLDPALIQASGTALRWPTAAPITDFPYLSSSYGWRRHPITGRQTMHEGLDFAAPRGTPIKAAAGGVVIESRFVNGYGNLVEIDHGDGLITRYAHASRLYVKQGDVVQRGQRVAAVGSSGLSTGPHLHFEVKLAGQPLDPRLFLPDSQPAGAAFASARPGEG